jgi:hypothetical protein
MAGISDDELKALVDGELRQSVGYFGGRLANSRQKALIYYEGLPKGDLAPPEIEGRSSVVSTDVRNVILSVLPSLMEKFASGDKIVECTPNRQKDEQAAKDATEYMNWLFMNQCNGHRILETAFMDALISKTGVIKIWWDTRAEENREEYKGLSDIELAEILDDEEVEPIEHDAYPDEEDAEQRNLAIQQLQEHLASIQTGNPAQQMQAQGAVMAVQQQINAIQSQPPKMLHDIAVKRCKTGGKIQIENVPPEEFMVSRKVKSLDPDREPNFFVCHRVLRTASELKSMGYKDVEDLTSDDNQNQWSMERVERQSWDDEYSYMTQAETPSLDPSQRLLSLSECYLKCDYNGDGIAELRRVVKVGNRILENDECDAVPFAVLRPIHMPHRFFGLSLADLAMEPQRITTNILRAMLDNLHFQTNGRFFAVENQVNLDDLLTSRPGGVVRIKTPGAVGRLDQGVADSSGAMNMLQYMHEFTEEATGWNRTSNASDDPNSINLTATAANLASNKANQRTDMIARNLSEGIKDMFRLMLKLVCQHQDKLEELKFGDSWVSLNPREWRNLFEVEIAVGLGTGSKDQQVQHLMMLMQVQREAAQIGIATPQNIYASVKQLTSALGYRNPDMFWTDPQKNPQPTKPDPDLIKTQAQIQADMQKHSLDMQQRQQELQQEAAIREREIQLEAQKQQMQAQADMKERQHKAELDAALEQQRMQFDEWKAKLDAETKILVAQISSQAKNIDPANEHPQVDEFGHPIPKPEEVIAAAMQGFSDSLKEITYHVTRPKQVIRDESNGIVGFQ